MKNKIIATTILATLMLLSASGIFATEDYGITNHPHKDRRFLINVDEKIIYVTPDNYTDQETLAQLNDTIGKAFNWLKKTTELKAYVKLQTIIRSHISPEHADNILDTLNINNKEKLKNFFKTNKEGTALENELASKLDDLEKTIRKNKEGYNAVARLQANSGKNLLSGAKYHTDYEDIGRGATILEKAYNGLEKAPLEEKELATISKSIGAITRDISPTANNRAITFIRETIEIDTGIPEGAKILDSITKIKGKEYILNILEDPNKIIRKIPEIEGIKTPDAQIDKHLIEGKTLIVGDPIINVKIGALKDQFIKAAEQLKDSNLITNNPIRVIQIDATKRNFISKNPDELVNEKGLNELWNEMKSATTSVDEFWLKLKDLSGKERLWRFYEQNGILKGEVIE